MKCFPAQAILLLAFTQSCDAKSQFGFNKPSLVASVPPSKDVTLSGTKATQKAKETVSSLNRGGDAPKSTMKAATFNLVKGIVGAGVLSLPAGIAAFGDNQSAVFPAVGLIKDILRSIVADNFPSGLTERTAAPAAVSASELSTPP